MKVLAVIPAFNEEESIKHIAPALHRVLDPENINFEIGEGEFIVIYGPTGSGKSTLLKHIKKQIKPFGKISGEVLYYGENIDEISDLTSVCEIGFVFQNPESQLVADTVWHELAFSLENIGVKTQDMRKKIGEMACFFGLENLLDKSNVTYSSPT